MTPIPYNILVIIPNSSLLEAIGETVTLIGHNPILVGTEKEALESASREQTAVAILDWDLSLNHFPGILRKLKAVNPLMGNFVLINQETTDFKIYVQNGELCGYLKRPFHLEEFEQGVTRCIRNYEKLRGKTD